MAEDTVKLHQQARILDGSIFRRLLSAGAQPLILLLLGLASVVGEAWAQSVDVYVSSVDGDRLTRKASINLQPAGDEPPSLSVNDSVELQEMIGFGASFMEAGIVSLNSLPLARQERVMEALFDAENGAGFSAMKTAIGLTDFQSAGPPYSYAEVPGDVDMESFTIERDLGPNGLVTYIKRALRYGTFTLQAVMDYPPDWMLVALDPHEEQKVQRKYYDALALYYLRYLQEYEKQGIVIDYLSPFNEPGAYTKITYPEIGDLIKNHVGPLFKKSGVRTLIQVSDAAFMSQARERVPLILDDPEARQYISSISYHNYDFRFKTVSRRTQNDLRDAEPTLKEGFYVDQYQSVRELHEMYPDLPLWMTEVCYFEIRPRVKEWQPDLPRYDFEDGEFWGLMIAANIEAGASGWTYWNMILDQNGGPPLVSPEHRNPPHNIQHPVVIINRETGQVTYTGLYWYLAHFSKFVRSGSIHIRTNGSTDGVTLLAFKRPDGAIVLEAMNHRNTEARIDVGWRDRVLGLALPRNSISTYIWDATG